jgi:hypothetical protein
MSKRRQDGQRDDSNEIENYLLWASSSGVVGVLALEDISHKVALNGFGFVCRLRYILA